MSRGELWIPRKPMITTPPESKLTSASSEPSPEDTPPSATSAASTADSNDAGTLLLGRGINFNGSIVGASRIVIEGTFESKHLETAELVIGRTGVFRGEADVNHADIDGRFEGVLKVKGRLSVLSNGSMVGSAQYGNLAVQPGGTISGDLAALRD